MNRLATPTQILPLREYVSSSPVPMSPDQLRSLRAIAPSIEITPADEPGRVILKPKSHVGTVTIEGLGLVVQTKIPLSRVLFMVAYGMERIRWQRACFDWAEDVDLVEAVVPAFVSHVRRVARRGLLQGYQTVDEAAMAIRGRIRFDDQIRERLGIVPPVEVTFDEYTVDILENRLLRAAAQRLSRMRLRSDASRASLRQAFLALDLVSAVEVRQRDVPAVRYSRLNQHYRSAVELARWILTNVSFEIGHAGASASAMLVDMNGIFEDFVVVALREALGLSDHEFPPNCHGRSLTLDQAASIKLEPDISWWDGDRCVFIGDAKYKRIRGDGVPNDDVYQMLAYLTATNLQQGTLIYAAGEAEPVTHVVRHAGKQIEVVSLDVSGPPGVVLSNVKELAIRIRDRVGASRAASAA